MEIKTRWVSQNICEVTVSTFDAEITEDVLNFRTGLVDQDFIEQLRNVLSELEEHNELMSNE